LADGVAKIIEVPGARGLPFVDHAGDHHRAPAIDEVSLELLARRRGDAFDLHRLESYGACFLEGNPSPAAWGGRILRGRSKRQAGAGRRWFADRCATLILRPGGADRADR